MNSTPEKKMREVVDTCADCDSCRDLIESCRLFPELYRLWDREQETGIRISTEELRHLTELCNFCGLCSCPDIREKIFEAKSGFVQQKGLPPALRLLEDVANVGRICGALPRLSNFLLTRAAGSRLIKQAAGIHKDRSLPTFPDASFFSWARDRQITHLQKQSHTRAHARQKVMLFAGCTGAYLFPQVPIAAVEILEKNGIHVRVPKQGCCGMPSLLEGDRKTTLTFAEKTLDLLSEAIANGYTIVTTCPTCGYMLKDMLPRGAWFSPIYQKQAGGDDKFLVLPEKIISGNPEKQGFRKVWRGLYKTDSATEGYFSPLDPIQRITVSENTLDFGEYLLHLLQQNQLDIDFGALKHRMAYYPPCHLREQNIGQPYLKLLNLIQDLDIAAIEGVYDCCGMAGIMGYKQSFHDASIAAGKPLMDKIDATLPEGIITDCLSCRLQFQHMADYAVWHPVEILKKAYDASL